MQTARIDLAEYFSETKNGRDDMYEGADEAHEDTRWS